MLKSYQCYGSVDRRIIMSNSIPGNQKHLTLHDRQCIEDSLDQGLWFQEIAKFLCKDPTTISKEIRLHRMDDIHPRL